MKIVTIEKKISCLLSVWAALILNEDRKMHSAISVIDVHGLGSPDLMIRQAVALEIDKACREIGFLIIKNHDVPLELMQSMYSITKNFFDLPIEEKLNYTSPIGSGYRGYTPLASESLAKTLDSSVKTADLYEAFTMGKPFTPDDEYHRHAPNFFAPNVWPNKPKALHDTWIAYYQAIDALAMKLMRAFALGLGLAEEYFDKSLDKHITNLRAINYPDQVASPLPGQVRAGAHTDYGSLTILMPDDAPGGLEVLTKNGIWEKIPYIPGTFVINIGDLMARWTNDQWVSTMHRVSNPPTENSKTNRRQSIAFFHQPNYDALIECIPTCKSVISPAKYEPILSGEHFQVKIMAQNAKAC